ncbi:MAG: hypothetical protein IOD12_03300 [Silvanigrellales bacterium]|jgi:hypothetical protein|nr:hypothetical protein [Silvanigrellales bacterium]
MTRLARNFSALRRAFRLAFRLVCSLTLLSAPLSLFLACRKAPPPPGAVSSDTKPPTASRGSVSGREVLKRARIAVTSSETALTALAAKPSSAALGKACILLGEVEAYLVTLAYLASEKIVTISTEAGDKSALHADPMGWVSTADRLAPLCSRPGSSADDFSSDIAEVRANLEVVGRALVTLK